MTATTSMTKFLPMVLPHVPECPHGVATFNLRLAAIEFCERTLCWRHISTARVASDGIALCAPSYAAIHKIEKVTFGDDKEPLTPIQYSDVDEAGFSADAGSKPKYITQAAYNTLRILPFTAGDISLSVFLKPVNGNQMQADADGIMTDNFDAVPHFIYTMHAEAIACGALARLLAQPQKPWSDPKMAGYYASKFEDKMNDSFSVSLTGQQRAKRRTRHREF